LKKVIMHRYKFKQQKEIVFFGLGIRPNDVEILLACIDEEVEACLAHIADRLLLEKTAYRRICTFNSPILALNHEVEKTIRGVRVMA
jgi:predicted transcriptional regulator